MFLDAGDANAGRSYYMLGSVSGTTPGFALPYVTVPLVLDAYSFLLIDLPNVLISSQIGTLDGLGQATATFQVPPGTPANLMGVTFYHAFVLLSPKDFASNPVTVTLIP